MAKESMKAREVKRAKLVARYAEKRATLKKIIATTDCTIDARLRVAPRGIFASLAFLASSSARWPLQVLYLELRKQAGRITREVFIFNIVGVVPIN